MSAPESLPTNAVDTAPESGVANHDAPRSPLFDQAVAITRAYADRLHKDAALVEALRDVVNAATSGVNDRNVTAETRLRQCAEIARAALARAQGGAR